MPHGSPARVQGRRGQRPGWVPPLNLLTSYTFRKLESTVQCGRWARGRCFHKLIRCSTGSSGGHKSCNKHLFGEQGSPPCCDPVIQCSGPARTSFDQLVLGPRRGQGAQLPREGFGGAALELQPKQGGGRDPRACRLLGMGKSASEAEMVRGQGEGSGDTPHAWVRRAKGVGPKEWGSA